MMTASTSNHSLLPRWQEASSQRLQQLLARSVSSRQAALVLVNSLCALIVVSPMLVSVAATIGAARLYSGQPGPLDWFIIEILATLAAVSALVTLQLLRICPEAAAAVSINQNQAEVLHEILARRVKHFKTPPVPEVVATAGSELRIVSTPSRVLPLWHNHRLEVGIPLLHFLSPAQFRLVLASVVHSFSYRQHYWRGWLTQAILDWPVIAGAMARKNNLAARLMLGPLRWTMAFNRHLAPDMIDKSLCGELRWLRENSTDNSAMEFLGARNVARAFLNRQFWPMIFKASERCPRPVLKPFSQFDALLDKLLNSTEARRWLLEVQTSRNKNVRNMLASLGFDHIKWSGLPRNAAVTLLKDAPKILQALDALWQEQVQPEWEARHAKYQAELQRFEQLNKRARRKGLRGRSALNFVQLAERFISVSQLGETYLAIYSANMDDAAVCFACGEKLLDTSQQQQGIEALEQAASLDRSFTHRVNSLVNDYRRTEFEDSRHHATAC